VVLEEEWERHRIMHPRMQSHKGKEALINTFFCAFARETRTNKGFRVLLLSCVVGLLASPLPVSLQCSCGSGASSTS